MHTEIYTYFTKPNGESELLYSAESWVHIRLALETTGPVAVSTRQSVIPVLTGRGVLLANDGEPFRFVLPKGDRVFIAAEAVNRVQVTIEPFPWVEQILAELKNGFGSLKGLLGSALRRKNQKPAAPDPKDPACPPKLKIPKFKRRR